MLNKSKILRVYIRKLNLSYDLDVGLEINKFKAIYSSLNRNDREKISSIIKKKIKNKSDNLPLFILIYYYIRNENIDRHLISNTLLEYKVPDNRLLLSWKVLRIFQEIYKINIRPIQEKWINTFSKKFIKEFNIDLNKSNTDNKIFIVVKDFPVHLHHGAHFTLFESFLKAIKKGREPKVNFIFIKGNTSVDILADFYLRENEMPKYVSEKIIEKYNDLNIEVIEYIDLKKILLNYNLSEFTCSYFIGGFLDCFNERIFFKNFGITINYILFHEKNLIDCYIDNIIASQSIEKKCSYQKTLKIKYPVNPLWLEEFTVENRKYDKYPLNIVTVLGGGRIEQALWNLEIKIKKKLISMLEKYNVVWNFIGVKEINKVLNFFKGCDVKLNFITTTENNKLSNVYKDMDIYFQIPGSEGGGTSMLQATISGLAIVAYKNGAAASYINEEILYSNSSEAISLLERMIIDLDFRKKCSIENVNFVKNELNINKIANILQRMENNY